MAGKEFNNGFSMATPDSSVDEWYQKFVEEKIEAAYHAGLMHGINVASMARVKRDVMTFEDYEWQTE